MKDISFYKSLLTEEIDEKLIGGQKKLDVAEPKGELTAADFAALRDKKDVNEQDHEVSMAQSSLKSIISSASELMNLIGQDEKDIPAWIQDHITNAENYINQASKNYHEYNKEEQAPEDEMSLENMMEDLFEAKKKKPSAGLTKKQKSAVVKKAKAGKDIGKKGKGFAAIEKKAKESGAKDPKAVAAAAMWKSQKRKK
jgi:hypothetical protein